MDNAQHLETCPDCRGTGLEFEEARLLRERKTQLTPNEIAWLINRKVLHHSYTTDGTTAINFKITKNDIINIINQRGLMVPCLRCKGKGKIHSPGN